MKSGRDYMSLLSLQTAMFASFATGRDGVKPQFMNGLTGGGVCMMIFGMGVYMILSAKGKSCVD